MAFDTAKTTEEMLEDVRARYMPMFHFIHELIMDRSGMTEALIGQTSPVPVCDYCARLNTGSECCNGCGAPARSISERHSVS